MNMVLQNHGQNKNINTYIAYKVNNREIDEIMTSPKQ